ncbi:unnamed protein product (macronuclear) [Paramecium tetraurelia]|uniref:Uncharacterized protein n=1 Tax=Paramecium tetraurelia TaxID=5888 RepID=A0BK48_PARTE|nr:uncharacterized protein GSPATT00029545001 [Paramecium tetraurelia]CAK58915.1 unnamed protein product [Paramecium tetraurelia]|eukprot:XP_001426313.1 hypothetical protein (macronuclear) [Paramecium tetraurelia strain d4-2]
MFQASKLMGNNQERRQIEEVIRQIKGPYQPFQKKIKLKNLVQILQEIWEEEEEY